ncbi:MAG: hypothetical protein R3F43_24330 [bacterium]
MAKTVEDVNGAPIRPGDELIYRLRVENTGGAVGAMLRDPPAAELAFVDARAAAQRRGADVVDPGDLPVDTRRELTPASASSRPWPTACASPTRRRWGPWRPRPSCPTIRPPRRRSTPRSCRSSRPPTSPMPARRWKT